MYYVLLSGQKFTRNNRHTMEVRTWVQVDGPKIYNIKLDLYVALGNKIVKYTQFVKVWVSL